MSYCISRGYISYYHAGHGRYMPLLSGVFDGKRVTEECENNV